MAKVLLAGELDLSTEGLFQRALLAAESNGRTGVILEFSGLTFMDSTGLAALLSAVERARESGRALVVKGVHGEVRKLLTLSGLHWMLEETASTAQLPDPDGEDQWEGVPLPEEELGG